MFVILSWRIQNTWYKQKREQALNYTKINKHFTV